MNKEAGVNVCVVKMSLHRGSRAASGFTGMELQYYKHSLTLNQTSTKLYNQMQSVKCKVTDIISIFS